MLPFVARIFNSTPVIATGFSPAQLVYGDRMELDRSILIPYEQRTEHDINLHEWVRERQLLQDTSLTVARDLYKKRDRQHIEQDVDEDVLYTHYPIGSYVLVAYPATNYGQRRPSKLHSMLRGPYQVLGNDLHHEYTLMNLVTKKEEKKNIFLLRPYQYDATRTDPHKIALQDYQDEYLVEEVVSHEGNWSRPSQMRFTVRWQGFDEVTPDQKYVDLKNNEKFHQYLRKNRKEKLIPKDCIEDTSSKPV